MHTLSKQQWTGKSSPFFCAKNLTYWRTGGKSSKRKICGKSGGSCKAENLVWKIPLENLENSEHGKSGGKSAEKFIDWKICGESGKSGLTGKSENVKYIRYFMENLVYVILRKI